MGGLFSHEYVTGPIVGSHVSIFVSLVNTSANDTLAGIFVMPTTVTADGFTVPAQSILSLPVLNPSGFQGGSAPPFQGWLSIQLQSDRVVPTVTITSEAGTQVYLPGDLAVFDLATGARLW